MIGLAALDPNNPAANITTDPNGQLMQDYCAYAGQLFSPSYCTVPSVAETAAYVNAEMATTSLTPANQAAATAAGNAAISADEAANPSGYIAQCAASNYPTLSSILGPSIVGALVGCNPDGSQGTPWGLYAILAVGAIAVVEFSRR